LVNISNTLNDERKALWFPTFSFLGRGSISYPSRKDDRKTPLEAAVLFEYGKEEGHWVGEELLEQLKMKALPITAAL
jgi:hypothetical protein